MKLVDANIWLALAFGNHVHHARVAAWFHQQADGTCAFCRITQLALLRHLTNPAIMRADVKSQVEAWQIYDALRADSRVIFLDEPAGIEHDFRARTQAGVPAHHAWTDAYLAAFAKASGCQLTTCDRGFQQFKDVTFELL
jgi:hypothetical protein